VLRVVGANEHHDRHVETVGGRGERGVIPVRSPAHERETVVDWLGGPYRGICVHLEGNVGEAPSVETVGVAHGLRRFEIADEKIDLLEQPPYEAGAQPPARRSRRRKVNVHGDYPTPSPAKQSPEEAEGEQPALIDVEDNRVIPSRPDKQAKGRPQVTGRKHGRVDGLPAEGASFEPRRVAEDTQGRRVRRAVVARLLSRRWRGEFLPYSPEGRPQAVQSLVHRFPQPAIEEPDPFRRSPA
jgi:hypothetical protein